MGTSDIQPRPGPHDEAPANPGILVRSFLGMRDELHGYIAGLVGDPEAAEEVFQEVGLAVMSESARSPDVRDAGAYLRGLARNRIADYYRRTRHLRRHEKLLDEFLDVVDRAWQEADARDLCEEREALRFLRQCMGRLAERARSIVELRYGKGMSLAEVARAVSWKVNAVKVSLSKSKKALRECVAAHAGGTRNI